MITEQEIRELEVLLDETSQMFRTANDIHTYTVRLGDICRKFIEADNKHFQTLDKALPIQETNQQVLAICREEYITNVTRTLGSIQSFTGVDGETQLPLQALFQRVWALSSTYDNKWLVCDNLNHNVVTGGGCLPGIAARLVHPYTIFLFAKLKNQYQIQNGLQVIPNVFFNQDDDLAQSLLASDISAIKEEEYRKHMLAAMEESEALAFAHEITFQKNIVSDQLHTKSLTTPLFTQYKNARKLQEVSFAEPTTQQPEATYLNSDGHENSDSILQFLILLFVVLLYSNFSKPESKSYRI